MRKATSIEALMPKIYAMIAGITLATFGMLVGGYQLLFYSTPFA